MKSVPLPTQRNRVALGLLALVLALTLWATVFAADAQAANVRLDGVRTTLTTDPDTTTLLFSVGIIPLPIYPTPIVPTTNAAKYSFPVTGGMVDAKTLAGNIRHSGGLLLAKRNPDNSWTALGLSNFTIRIDAKPDLTAIVTGVGRALDRRSRPGQHCRQEVREERPRFRQDLERARHPQQDRHRRHRGDLPRRRGRSAGQRPARHRQCAGSRGSLTDQTTHTSEATTGGRCSAPRSLPSPLP